MKQLHATYVIYISMPNCSVCHAVLPQLEQLVTKYAIPAFHLDAFDIPEVASMFEVLTAPAVLVYQDNRELDRQARFINLHHLEDLFQELESSTKPISYEELFGSLSK